MTDKPTVYRWECPKECYVNVTVDYTNQVCVPHMLPYAKKKEVRDAHPS
jgi:hypothetical protein